MIGVTSRSQNGAQAIADRALLVGQALIEQIEIRSHVR
jgi:hypothetical protein